MMKRMFFMASMAMVFAVATAQTPARDYIVKTKNVKKAVAAVSSEGSDSTQVEDENGPKDFISQHFRFYSLCDWEEGMKFMVMPEKYDMVVRTFHDAETKKEVSSMTLRHRIMIYKGHEEVDGRTLINFECQDEDQKFNGKKYYYEVPNGSFDDYCYGKLGVPTLAYLGDVDIAREHLLGRKVYTRSSIFRIDTENEGEGYREVKVSPNEEVTITGVGVGSRSFPVKIIVTDKNDQEYYQTVAISRTNSGMRDDEFIMDSLKHQFAGSFELVDDISLFSKHYSDYVGKTIHTIRPTIMLNERQTKNVSVSKMNEYIVENAREIASGLITLTLKNNITAGVFYKDVTFDAPKVTPDTIDGKKENYFGYIFAMGPGKVVFTSTASRAMIREGRVAVGMSEDEVMLAVGEPDATNYAFEDGTHEWTFNRSQGKKLIVKFGKDAKVLNYRVQQPKATTRRTTTARKGRTTVRRSTGSTGTWKNGTPL